MGLAPAESPGADAAERAQEARFRVIFRRLHAGHPRCLADEWLTQSCATERGPVERPIAWSRRNGPWRRSEILWVGAAPGNAGGKGKGALGAHGTRIPFGGDVAGANLDALLGSIGITRNDTFITATLNQLPAAGGGEPTRAEIAAPVGAYPSSLHALRDTLLAAGPGLVVALGNVALGATLAAAQLPGDASPAGGVRTLSPARIARTGLRRGQAAPWPETEPPSAEFLHEWGSYWGKKTPLPQLLWLTHPSAQNMSPYARVNTVFHTRMLEARAALQAAVRAVLGHEPPARRGEPPATGIYALPEWRELIGPRHAVLDRLWREKGV